MPVNEYDEAIDRLEGDAPQPTRDPLDEAIDRIDASSATRVKQSLLQTQDSTPEHEAEARRLSLKFGTPPAIVSRQLETFQRREAVDKPFGQMAFETPATSTWLETPENVALAKDDLENLGFLEWVVTAPQRAFAQGVNQIRHAQLRSKQLRGEPMTEFERDMIGATKREMNAGGELGASNSWFRGAVTGGARLLTNVIGGAEYAAKYSAALGTGGALGGFAGGGPAGAAAGAAAGGAVGAVYGAYQFGVDLEAGLAYDEFLDLKDSLGRPMDPGAARLAALAAGYINGGLELVQIERLVSTIPGADKLKGAITRGAIKQALRQPTVVAALADAAKTYAGTLATESTTEAAQRAITVLSGELGKVTSGQDFARLSAGDVAAQAGQEFVGAIQAFALMPLPGVALQVTGDVQRANRAKGNAAFFTNLAEGVTQSKTVQRAPEAAMEFLAAATKDGPLETVYAPTDVWRTYWQDKGIDPAEMAAEVTGRADALEVAENSGGDLAIPTARYAVKLAPTDHNAFFAAELRVGPEEMSLREATEFLDAQQQLLKAQQGPATTARQERFEALVEQLTATGLDETSARKYASVYEAFESLGQRSDVELGYGLQVGRSGFVQPAEAAPPTAAPPEGATPPEAATPAPAAEAGAPLEAVLPTLEDAFEMERRRAPGQAPEGVERRTASGQAVTMTPEAIMADLRSRGVIGQADPNADLDKSQIGPATLRMFTEDPTFAARLKDFTEAARTVQRQNKGPREAAQVPIDTEAEAAQTGEGVAPAEGARAENGPVGGVSVRRIEASTPESRRESPTQRDARRTKHYASIFRAVSQAAKQLDPQVNIRAVRQEFNSRVEMVESLDQEWQQSGQNPRVILEAIAAAGGISVDFETKTGGMGGELRWVRDSPQFGAFGAFAGVRGVFQTHTRGSAGQRRSGLGLDEITTAIRQDPRFDYIETPNDLVDVLSDIARMSEEAPGRGTTFPGTEELRRRAGIDPRVRWWLPGVELNQAERSLFEEEPGPTEDVLDTGEVQPRLPGAEGVRDQEIATPEIEAPFSLTSPVSKAKGKQDTLFQGPKFEPKGFEAVSPYLTEAELAKLRSDHAKKLVAVFKGLPSDEDFQAAAQAGEVKRGWYKQAADMLREVFGEVDAPRFAALLAATSPQVDVETNLRNTAAIWVKWNAAGRPVKPRAIEKVLGAAVPGAPLPAWIDNTVRALSADDPLTIKLSGPKVDSFQRNLHGNWNEVTNDSWMAAFAGVNQKLFAGEISQSGPGKGPGYLAMSAKIRRVAEQLTEQTGQTWTPAEVQETIWSWAKTLTELAETEGLTPEQVLERGLLTDAAITSAPDFASLLTSDSDVRTLLEAGGYGPQLTAIADAFGAEPRAGDAAAAAPRAGEGRPDRGTAISLVRSARRIAQQRAGQVTELGQSAFHGSPHIFDKFTLQAIGSGEGAQVYGWGLYFASLREVAEGYRDRLASGRSIADSAHLAAAQNLIANGADDAATLQALQAAYQTADPADLQAALDEARGRRPGRVYKVEIPDDADFLDWDKPAAEQSSKVKAALEQLGVKLDDYVVPTPSNALQQINEALQSGTISPGSVRAERLREGAQLAIQARLDSSLGNDSAPSMGPFRAWWLRNAEIVSAWGTYARRPITGEELYKELSSRASATSQADFKAKYGFESSFLKAISPADSAKLASQMLASVGVAGIRYLDGFSRDKGAGTSNYVVFDDSLVQITEFYQAGPRQSLEELRAQGFDTSRPFYHQTSEANLEAIEGEGFDLSKGRARLSDEQVPDGVFLKPNTKDIGVGASGAPGDQAVQVPLYVRFGKVATFDDRAQLERRLRTDETYATLVDEARTFDKAQSVEFDRRWEKLRKLDMVNRDERAQHKADLEIDEFLEEWKRANNERAAAARARATELLRADGVDTVIIRKDAGSLGRTTETIIAIAGNQLALAEPGRERVLFHASVPLDEPRLQAFASEVKASVDGLLEFDLRLLPSGAIQLETLAAASGALAGTGSKALDRLIAFADQHGRRIELSLPEKGYTPNEAGKTTTSPARLRDFYKRFGFVDNKGRNKRFEFSIYTSMYREPQAQQPPPRMNQERRGSIRFGEGPNKTFDINLFAKADLSTFLHETGHLFLEVFGDVVEQLQAIDPEQLTPDQRRVFTDYQAALTFLGVESRDQITEKQHEQWARAFEAYLFEGKAPSLELRSAFASFRAWLLGIYRTLRALDVELTDDVRRVFDRLLATDEQIAAAEAQGQVTPLFLTAEQAGMDPQRFELYRQQVADVSRQAQEKLQQQMLAEVAREQTAVWKARREEVRVDVEADVHNRPIYLALSAMQRGTHPDGTPLGSEDQEPVPMKLSRQAIVDQFGKARLATLPRPYIYSRSGGLTPDAAAELFGFSSGDELLTEAATARPMNQVIEEQIDARMRAEYGSILLDGTMFEKATASLSNEARASVIRAELRALGELRRMVDPMLNKEGARVRREERAAADYEARWAASTAQLEAAKAANVNQAAIAALQDEVDNLKRKANGGPATIAAAIPPQAFINDRAQQSVNRTRVRDLKPAIYWSAARRASRQATDAAARQDFDAAILAKQQELLNLALYRAATDAVDDAQQRAIAARDLSKPSIRKKIGLVDQTFLDQIDGILARYEFADVTNKKLEERASLRKWVAAMEAEGLPVDIPDEIIDDARELNYRELTYEELVGVTDALKHIAHLSRQANRQQATADAAEFAQTRDGIVASIYAHNTVQPTPLEFDRTLERKRGIADWFASHTKIATLARRLDGHQDNGQLWNHLIRPINKASDDEQVRKRTTGEAYRKIVNRHYRGRDLATLRRKVFIPAINASLTKEARLAVALNWGNETSRSRLLNDPRRRWSAQQIEGILETLDGRDWAFVQDTWDYLDTFWPEIAAKQERVTGLAPEKVAPASIVTPFGLMRGGYYPLAYDGRLSIRASWNEAASEAKLATAAAYVRSTTKRGHTINRQQNVKLSVRLDLGVAFDHLDQVIHDLTHHEVLLDATRLLRDPKISNAILETQGDVVYQQFTRALQDIAIGHAIPRNRMDKAAAFMRTGSQIALLGWNFWTSLQQPLGLFNGMSRVGVPWVARGLKRWLRDAVTMESTVKWIHESSPFMRERHNTATQDLAQLRDAFRRPGGWFDTIVKRATADVVTQQHIIDSFLWHIALAQRVADVPTWIGAYEKAKASGADVDDATAYAIADQAVIDSQGSGSIKDLSQLQRGGPIAKLFMTFYTYGATIFNETSDRLNATNFRSPASLTTLLGHLSLLYVAPAVLTVALANAVGRREDEDEGEWLAAIGLEILSTALNTMVLLREFSGLLTEGVRGYAGPAGARAIELGYRLGNQVKQGEVDEALLKAINQAGGVLFRYPAAQVERTVDGIVALEEGRTKNPAALLFGAPKEKK